MLPFIYKVPTFNGEYGHVEVKAIRTATPGILITGARPDLYRLTHEASGMAITRGVCAMTSDLFGLLTLAADLAAVGDWTQNAASIEENIGAKAGRLIMSASIEWQGLAVSPEHDAASVAFRSRTAD